ncbi:MAG: ribbon-helix-helix domain-containing protein [Pseudomonadota bacterium]
MSKRKHDPLAAVLDQDNRPEEASASAVRTTQVPPVAAPEKPDRQASRVNKVNVSAYLDPSYKRTLRRLAAEEDTTVQALIQEGLDLLFTKKGY